VSLRTPEGLPPFLDVVGAGLFVCAPGWMALTTLDSGGSAVHGIGLLLVCGFVLVTVRIVGPSARLIVPAAALLGAVVIVAVSRTGVLSTAPLSGPLEYVNADAALYLQAAIAGLMLATGGRLLILRVIGGVGAAIFGVLPFAIHAAAAAWLVVVLPGIALLLHTVAGAKGARTAVAVCGFLFAASLLTTIGLGAAHSPGEENILERAAAGAVDDNRLDLWHDAITIMQQHPLTGIGAGRYQVVSPIARQDSDRRWAHNEFLQQGAEGGFVGLAFLSLIFLWGFSRLWTVRSPDAFTALSAASLAALGIHACIDYVIHFPMVSIMAAGLVATGMIERQFDPLWVGAATATDWAR
jgi:O-antigen ligase/polysaccharide polymerase Wzy-like membrane protein